MRIDPLYLQNRFHRILPLLLSLFLFLVTFCSLPVSVNQALDDHLAENRPASIHTAGNLPADDACREEGSEHDPSGALSKPVSRNTIQIKSVRILLMACLAVCTAMLCQYKGIRACEKAASRSRHFILQYIHDMDGKKG